MEFLDFEMEVREFPEGWQHLTTGASLSYTVQLINHWITHGVSEGSLNPEVGSSQRQAVNGL